MADLAALTADQLAEKVRGYIEAFDTPGDATGAAWILPFLAELVSRLKATEDALDMLWTHYLLPISDEQKAQVLAALPSPDPNHTT